MPPNKTVVSVSNHHKDNAQMRKGEEERVPYDTGHGDFRFGRLSDFVHYSASGEILNEQEWREESGGVTVEELGGFRREGAFHFFQLPDEIRRMILELLVAPFYTRRNQSNVVRFLAANIACYLPKHTFDWSYDLIRRPQKINDDSLARPADHFLLDWFLKLSHVSNVFRHELCQAFWSKVEISLQVFNNFYALPQILRTRPAICGGIKILSITMESSHCGTRRRRAIYDEGHFTTHKGFSRWCEYAANHLELEEFNLTLEVPEIRLQYAVGCENEFLPLLSIRLLRVTGSFNLYLHIIGRQSKDHEYYRNLQRTTATAIEELLKPTTLRTSSTPQSETEAYLMSRL